MSERYSRLFSLPENLYLEGAPVLIVAGALLKDNKENRILAQLKFRNISTKTIQALKVAIRVFDISGDSLRGVNEFQYLDLCVDRNIDFGQKIAIPLPDAVGRSFECDVTAVIFKDNSIWEAPDGASWTPLKKPLTLTEALGIYKDQYLRDTNASSQTILVPTEDRDLWHCTCGAINQSNESHCNVCDSLKELIFSAMDLERLAENQATYEEERRQLKERELAEQARQKQLKEEQLAQEKEHARLLRKKRIKIGMIIISLIITAIAIYLIGWQLIPHLKYKSAKDSLNSHEFDKAHGAFIALGGYKDSEQMANESLYLKATHLMDAGEFNEAIVIFKQLSPYRDSREQSRQCQNESSYLKAFSQLDQNDLEGALDSFIALGDFKDSETQASEITYRLASSHFEKNEYDTARELFASLGTYKDSETKTGESIYQLAVEAFEGGLYEEAYEYFKDVANYRDSEKMATESKYQHALLLYKNEQFRLASEIFEELGNFKDSPDQFLASKYDHACWLTEKMGNWPSAITAFEELGNYKDSKDLLNDTMYRYAIFYKTPTSQKIYDYLEKLRKINYKDSNEIFNNLYKWTIKLKAANTNRNDYSTILSSVSRKENYFHMSFQLSGGKPGQTITLKNKTFYPGGSDDNTRWYWENNRHGETFGIEWSDGFVYPAGTLTVKIYDKSTGAYIGEGSVKLR